MLIRIPAALWLCLCAAIPSQSQTTPDLQRVLERLDKLEQQNKELLAEVQELRRQLTPAASAPATPATTGPPVSERMDVQESRTDELAQTKVGTTQRFPVALTGMILFNAFHNGGFGGTSQVPVTAQLTESPSSTGASFRQSVIGLKFNGPDLPGGGKATGSAYFDFWGGTASPGNNLFRVRLATLDLTWKNTTITAGQDKPIVAPREPMTFAEVGLAPLTGAGNLWNWQPQVRVEQRFHFHSQPGSEAGIAAQAGIYETAEVYPGTGPASLSGTLEKQRPSWEARLLFFKGGENRRFEVAPGVSLSSTHVAGQSVNSRLASLDWLLQPSSVFAFSGAAFKGTNAAGLGSLRQGFTILPSGLAIPVHVTGGWGQLAIFAAPRLSFHLFGGEEADRASDLLAGSVRSNFIYAINGVYKLAPNVLAALEASQTRTSYMGPGLRINNHYDLSLAYLF